MCVIQAAVSVFDTVTYDLVIRLDNGMDRWSTINEFSYRHDTGAHRFDRHIVKAW